MPLNLFSETCVVIKIENDTDASSLISRHWRVSPKLRSAVSGLLAIVDGYYFEWRFFVINGQFSFRPKPSVFIGK